MSAPPIPPPMDSLLEQRAWVRTLARRKLTLLFSRFAIVTGDGAPLASARVSASWQDADESHNSRAATTVVDDRQQPIASAHVDVSRVGTRSSVTATTDAAGRFSTGGVEAGGELQHRGTDSRDRPAPGAASVTVPNGAETEFDADFGELYVRRCGELYEGRIDDRTFVVNGLPPGEYELEFIEEDWTGKVTATAGDQEVEILVKRGQ